MKIMLLFTYGPITFEPMGIFGFSFRLTSLKNKWDQQTKNKKDLEELPSIPFKEAQGATGLSASAICITDLSKAILLFWFFLFYVLVLKVCIVCAYE